MSNVHQDREDGPVRWFGLGVLGLGAVAIVAAALVFLLAGGARVTVISISNVSSEALEEISDIFPVEEGVYCAFDGCCKGEGGVSKIDVESGAVICASGTESETCRCERRDVIRQ